MDAIFTRTSVRSYEDKPVEQEKIEMILRAAMAAPSSSNQQPWEFYVVTNRDMLQQLSVVKPFAQMTAKAPVAIVPCQRKTGLKTPIRASIDMAICAENILLEIEAQGLGGVMLGVAPDKAVMDKVGEIIHVRENLEPFTIIPFGYPEKKHPQQDRFDAKRVHYIP